MDTGRITIDIDSLSICNNVTIRRFKSSTLAGYGRAMMRKIRNNDMQDVIVDQIRKSPHFKKKTEAS